MRQVTPSKSDAWGIGLAQPEMGTSAKVVTEGLHPKVLSFPGAPFRQGGGGYSGRFRMPNRQNGADLSHAGALAHKMVISLASPGKWDKMRP